jgi:hypothetical protein
MKLSPLGSKLVFALCAVAFLSLFAAGCASDDPDNVSSRPWNVPRDWEHGLPTTINEGR